MEHSGFESKRSQKSGLSGGFHGTRWAHGETRWRGVAYVVLVVLMTFMSFLCPYELRYWKVKWRNVGRINANLPCVHQGVLICQSLVKRRGKICRIFRGK